MALQPPGAFPTPPPTPPGVPVAARALLRKMDAKTATFQIGNRFWEVSLYELTPGKPDEQIDLGDQTQIDALAEKVRQTVLAMEQEKVIPLAKTKTIAFDADDKMQIHHIYHSEQDVTDTKTMNEIDVTTGKIGNLASTVLPSLGNEIKRAKEESKKHPSSRSATGSTAASPSTAIVTQDTVTSSCDLAFAGRPYSINDEDIVSCIANQIANQGPLYQGPFKGKSEIEIKTDLRKDVSKYILKSKEHHSTKFTNLHEELKALATKERSSIIRAAEATKTGKLVKTCVFGTKDVANTVINLINKTSPLSEDEKDKLVRLYAQYMLMDSSSLQGTFISAFQELYPSKRIVVLEEGSSPGTLTGLPASCDPSMSLFIYKNKTSGRYSSYNREPVDRTGGNRPHPLNEKCPNLNTSTKLPDPHVVKKVVLQNPHPLPIHYDVGGGGLCADLSLAEQVLILKQDEQEEKVHNALLQGVNSLFKALKAAIDGKSDHEDKLPDGTNVKAKDVRAILKKKEEELAVTDIEKLRTYAKEIQDARSATRAQLASNIRNNMADVIQSDAFDDHVELIFHNLREALQDGALPAKEMGGIDKATIETIIQAGRNIESDQLKRDEIGKLKTYYAAWLRSSERMWLDSAAFQAMSMEEFDASILPHRLQVAVVGQGSPPTSLRMRQYYPRNGAAPTDPKTCLFIHYNGHGHYHTVQRSSATLEQVLKDEEFSIIKRFMEAPNKKRFDELRVQSPRIWGYICHKIWEHDHSAWKSDKSFPEPKENEIPKNLDSGTAAGITEYYSRTLENYGEWRFFNNDWDETEQNRHEWQTFLLQFGINEDSLKTAF